MWPRWVWKGNLRSQDPQCCSHLRPLMMGQRVSRANRGRLSLAHTRTRAQWPFIVVSCGSPTSPSAFVGCDSDALLLRRRMDGCHAEVKAVRALLPITHLSPSLLKLLLFPQCNSVSSDLKPHTPRSVPLTVKPQLFVLYSSYKQHKKNKIRFLIGWLDASLLCRQLAQLNWLQIFTGNCQFNCNFTSFEVNQILESKQVSTRWKQSWRVCVYVFTWQKQPIV